VSYRAVRELRFPARFELREGRKSLTWTPCREDAVDDPQLEGLVVDDLHGVLYAAQEVVGIYKVPLPSLRSRVEYVPARHLIEPVTSFGAPYWAVPDEDEFACEGERPDELVEGTLAQAGSERFRGARLTADAEGLAIFEGRAGAGYLVASSQGDDTFHVYARRGGVTRPHANRFLGSFTVEGAGETDGHEVTSQPLGRSFPHGLFVMQNGKASGPANTEPVNGYPYDHATQFLLLDWRELAANVIDD
jgi:3-phytase